MWDCSVCVGIARTSHVFSGAMVWCLAVTNTFTVSGIMPFIINCARLRSYDCGRREADEYEM